jgi:3-hydroxyisobutyrate dehydrogenase
MSTISPIESKDISKKFLDIGIIKLDTPVMGGPNVAITGDLVLIVSGKRETFDKVRHIFEKIGKKIFFVEGSGTAHLIKLAMNLQIALLALALSEGITLVKSAKLDPQIFLDVLNATYFKTGMSENKAPKMIKGEFDPTFTLSNMKKDITTITETANSLGITLPIIKKAEEVYNKAIQNGFGEIDYTGILDHLREINEKSS